jgi:putative ABC transport system ATP-binding protein
MTCALELRHASKVYGAGPSEVNALRDVHLCVERGELVAVMGPSGSGKSTLLTIAGSLDQASSGEVLVDGIELATVSGSDRATMRRRSIGLLTDPEELEPDGTLRSAGAEPSRAAAEKTPRARGKTLARAIESGSWTLRGGRGTAVTIVTRAIASGGASCAIPLVNWVASLEAQTLRSRVR